MAITNKKIIPIEVRGEYILGSGVSIGSAGSINSTVLRVKFDDTWGGLIKYATWTDARGDSVEQIPIFPSDLVENEANTYDFSVPAFPLQYAGAVKLSFTGYAMSRYGENVDNLINTATGLFRVLESNAMRLDAEIVDSTFADRVLDAVTAMGNQINEIEKKEDEREERFSEAEAERQANFTEAERERQDNFDKAEAERQADFDRFFDELNIAQTPGDSENKVMSQKAAAILTKPLFDLGLIVKNGKVYQKYRG